MCSPGLQSTPLYSLDSGLSGQGTPADEISGLVATRTLRVIGLTMDGAVARRSAITEIEFLCFRWEPRYRTRLEENLQARGAVAFILQDAATHDLMGFTVARPTLVPHEAYVALSALRPECQGQKLIGVLRARVEECLRVRGYNFLSSESRADNGYAAKLIRHYGDRVVERRALPVNAPGEYPREFIKIRL